MSIADQVRNMETENAELAAKVASLEASNAALLAENARLASRSDQVDTHAQSTRTMAEKLASDALEMLRHARSGANQPPAADPYAPKTRIFMNPEASEYVIEGASFSGKAAHTIIVDDVPAETSATAINLSAPELDTKAVREHMAAGRTEAATSILMKAAGALGVLKDTPIFLKRDTAFSAFDTEANERAAKALA